MELAQLSPEEAELFREEMGLDEPATFRLIKESYQLLGLISLFTVGTDEVRAWPIRQDTPAQRAAGAIHSDMEKGFIRDGDRGRCKFIQLKVCILYDETSLIGCAWCFAPCYGTWN